MFKHLLLPIDGSKLSEATVQKGVQFAKSLNARIKGFYVMPEFHIFTYRTEMVDDTKQEFRRDRRAHADQYLAVIEKTAKAAGVACDTAVATSDYPYEAIIKAAAEKGCDLIMMASHGRSGMQGLLLGSETQKVLTHSKIPVLVYR
jgi:nucleotide-binding universal stress UspA family protein